MSDPFLSELRIMSFNFPPKGWALCNGQLLPINQNQGLFSLLGTTYGGDGRVTFGLPNLQGRVPVHFGNGFGNSITVGQVGGEMAHTLTTPEMPAHSHALMADATTSAASNTNTPAGGKVLGQSAGTGGSPVAPFNVNLYSTAAPNSALNANCVTSNGGNQPHANEQPYLVLSFCIALQGIFPSQT